MGNLETFVTVLEREFDAENPEIFGVSGSDRIVETLKLLTKRSQKTIHIVTGLLPSQALWRQDIVDGLRAFVARKGFIRIIFHHTDPTWIKSFMDSLSVAVPPGKNLSDFARAKSFGNAMPAPDMKFPELMVFDQKHYRITANGDWADTEGFLQLYHETEAQKIVSFVEVLWEKAQDPFVTSPLFSP